jgi:hypothetical protein
MMPENLDGFADTFEDFVNLALIAAAPSPHMPGSVGKEEIMQLRADLGLPIFFRGDYRGDDPQADDLTFILGLAGERVIIRECSDGWFYHADGSIADRRSVQDVLLHELDAPACLRRYVRR